MSSRIRFYTFREDKIMNTNFLSLSLPNELWDLIFKELVKINPRYLGRYLPILKYFDELIELNIWLKYIRLLLFYSKGKDIFNDIDLVEVLYYNRDYKGRTIDDNQTLAMIKSLDKNLNGGLNSDQLIYLLADILMSERLEIAKFLLEKYRNTEKLNRKDIFKYVFLDNCMEGHLDSIKLLTKFYNLGDLIASKIAIIIKYFCSDLKTAKWIIREFNLYNSPHIEAKKYEIFKCCCKHDDLNYVKWFTRTFNIEDNEKIKIGMNKAAVYGQLETVKWLEYKFNIGDRKIFYIYGICKNGHLDVLKWLHSAYNLAIRDIRDSGGYSEHCLEIACFNGHLKVAKWLVEEFYDMENYSPELVGNPMPYPNNFAPGEAYENDSFKNSFISGNIELVKWYIKTFKLTEEHFFDEIESIIKWNHCHHNTGKSLIDTFIPPEDQIDINLNNKIYIKNIFNKIINYKL